MFEKYHSEAGLHRPKAILLANADMKRKVFGDERIEALGQLLDLSDGEAALSNPELLKSMMADREIIVSTWGMPKLDPELLSASPLLRAVFYAAGSVKYFVTDAMWERSITVVSAWAANAVPVAEFASAQIVLGLKNYWAATRGTAAAKAWVSKPANGCYGKRVGLVGAGMIGRAVAAHLRHYDLEVMVYDPYVTPEMAHAIGAIKCDLADLFAECHCVSVHAPNIAETRRMVKEEHIRSMPANACFINTSRGALIDEPGLVRALKARPDITALLDVTDPEPPPAASELWSLPNLVISPHMAGAMDDECHRMVDYVSAELKRYIAGDTLRYKVTREMLSRMA